MKPHTEEEIKALFKLYLDQQTTAEQEAILFAYVAEHDHTEDLFREEITSTWHTDIGTPSTQRALAAKSTFRPVWLKYAASLFLICGIALSWYLINHDKEEQNHVAISQIIKSTKRGEKLKLLLPDSSVVYLNAMSKLSFPNRFEHGKKREITLEGEAFFEVKHDSSRPFIVHSGQLQTRVLGTSFNINAYPESRTFNVSVRTGKVGVSTDEKGKQQLLGLLTPGKHLMYNLRDKKYTVSEQKAGDFNSWTENRFIFRNETLGNILNSLKRSYLIDFKINSPKILSCHFNATFSNQNIKAIMNQLQTMSSGSIHYKLNPDTTVITLWGEACQ